MLDIDKIMEEMANAPPTDPLPGGNSHWLDPEGREGMSEYFWKYKYPAICECTGVDPKTRMPIEHV